MPFENEFNHKPDLETLLNDTLAGHERGESVQFDKVFELSERIRADDRIGEHLALLYTNYLLTIFSLPSSVDADMVERVRELATHRALAPQLFFGEGAEQELLASRESFMAAVMRRYETGEWPEGIGQLNLDDSIPAPEEYFTLETVPGPDWFRVMDIDLINSTPSYDYLVLLGVDFEELGARGISYEGLIAMNMAHLGLLADAEPERAPGEGPASAEVLAYLSSFVAIDQDRIFPILPVLTEYLPAEEYVQFLEKRSDLLKCPISLDSIDVPVTVGDETHAYDRDGLHRWLSSHDSTPLGRTSTLGISLESIRNDYSPKLLGQYDDIVRGYMAKLPEAVRGQDGDRRPELLFHDHQPEEGDFVAQERQRDMSPT
ncbi:hypothetical protein Psal006b_02289 [Piscirickettsia salmonis]|uniref:Pentapeptide repeats family protein n=2 Tax=Piscirickettsia salmonis TaxID=1238 RepID=A0A1L6TA98_PISSA|nr:hypothetical protein [Piscirickettsia salmonis]AKP73374.1 hypothetical protein PSLF89_1475 [Piscirickettsia salmonis LF-89 = ATCC VR-1361]ALB22102.1 pentapeptide repeats family protein [Piscirickettsia salmonis]ALY02227.1 hypothetical protein AWE47_04645 [Piscirickettsia salmonis]AMA41740.1 hypothetical protein AWJ11_04625 [Piscirickettsia salmonis]AOS34219.1 hypothetical protein AVM72_01860 [Piscirickettsia salmonis]